MTKCSHAEADKDNWARVAMCKSFPYMYQCLNLGNGADNANPNVLGGGGTCEWTPYQYSTGSF
jgi:hypothetical protein